MRRKLLFALLVAMLALTVFMGQIKGQEPEGSATSEEEVPTQPEITTVNGSDVTIAAISSNKFYFQGVIRENGVPVTGQRTISYRFWVDNPTCTGTLAFQTVEVTAQNGVFNAVLEAGTNFTGQIVAIDVMVGSQTIIACQEILPVPYALSLRPEAKILGATDSVNTPILEVGNTGSGNAVTARASGASGHGIFADALSTTGDTEGVIARVRSPGGEAIEAINIITDATSSIIVGCSPDCSVDIQFKVETDGDVFADGAISGGGADFAEMLPAAKGLEPGDVLVIGDDGTLIRSTMPNAANVAGVYSTKPGFIGGSNLDDNKSLDTSMTSAGNELSQIYAEEGKVPLAILGVVPVKVSAENGAIQPGDLLTTSATPGHAMKAEPVTINGFEIYAPGTLIGKALEPLEGETGVIKVLVTLQ